MPSSHDPTPTSSSVVLNCDQGLSLSAILETIHFVTQCLQRSADRDLRTLLQASLLRLTWLACQHPLTDQVRSELQLLNQHLRQDRQYSPVRLI